MGVYKDPHKFEKELAKLNAQLTIVTTGGSIFASFGAALVILGITIGTDAFTKLSNMSTFYSVLSSLYTELGTVIFILGIFLLIVAHFRIPKKIDEIKEN